jgi:hypothetical protein
LPSARARHAHQPRHSACVMHAAPCGAV